MRRKLLYHKKLTRDQVYLHPQELIQLSTTDPFDAVVDFYKGELDKYNPEIVSYTSELGRQTALTIKQEKRVITVAVQEHDEEGKVVISHMAVGR